MYIFRKSTPADKAELEKLFKKNFGLFAINNGALNPTKNRYWIAEYNNKIVAATGILPIKKSEYNGYEITWTCTNIKHRKKGLIVTMLQKAEAELPKDYKPLYCSCWRLKDNKEINLSSVMKHLGMHCLIKERMKLKYPHNRSCSECIYAQKGCYCYCDLYIKER